MDSALERREGALAISLLRQQFIHKIQLAHGNVKFIFGRYYPWILSMAWQRFCFRRFNFPFSMERIRDDWYMTLAKSHSAQPNWNSTNVHRKRTFHSFQLDWWSMAMHLSKYHVIHTQTNTRKKTPKAKIAFNRNKWMRCSLRVLFLLLLLLFHVYFDIIRLLIHFEFSAVLARTFISLSLALFGSFVFHSIMSINICVCHWSQNGIFISAFIFFRHRRRCRDEEELCQTLTHSVRFGKQSNQSVNVDLWQKCQPRAYKLSRVVRRVPH